VLRHKIFGGGRGSHSKVRARRSFDQRMFPLRL
jgi:hypothetical protein